jgi:hypothetical protein
MLWTTADSINARTRTNGYCGGSWLGPAFGTNSGWWLNGSKPEQIMTSSSTANMVMAAALLEAQFLQIVPRTQISSLPPANFSIMNYGLSFWPYQLQTSTNLAIWNRVTNFYINSNFQGVGMVSTNNGSMMFFRAIGLIQP